MIYTVGYQHMAVQELARLVEEYGVDRIIDVRSFPYSRKPGFNRNRLSATFGSRYLWRGDVLGGKRGPISDEAIRWLSEQKGVLLVMCMEAHPCDCHRHLDIGLRLLGMGVMARHFFEGKCVTTEELKEICDERHGRNLFEPR